MMRFRSCIPLALCCIGLTMVSCEKEEDSEEDAAFYSFFVGETYSWFSDVADSVLLDSANIKYRRDFVFREGEERLGRTRPTGLKVIKSVQNITFDSAGTTYIRAFVCMLAENNAASAFQENGSWLSYESIGLRITPDIPIASGDQDAFTLLFTRVSLEPSTVQLIGVKSELGFRTNKASDGTYANLSPDVFDVHEVQFKPGTASSDHQLYAVITGYLAMSVHSGGNRPGYYRFSEKVTGQYKFGFGL